MPFQASVTQFPALGVEGDFADSSPRSTVYAVEGLVAGAAGVTVGRFAWVQSDGHTVLNSNTSALTNAILGFVHREQQALITAYLGESSLLIPGGFGVNLFASGCFFARNTGAAAIAPGSVIYVDPATGLVVNSGTSGAVATKWYCKNLESVAVGELVAVSPVTNGI